MLSRDRALNVGKPQLIGQASEHFPEAADRIALPGARSAQQLFRCLTVVLYPLDDGQTVMDFAWCFGHDGHLRSPASAFGLERASRNRVGTHHHEAGTSLSADRWRPRSPP